MDEAYLDITAVIENGQKPLAVALDLKSRIFDETGLVVSVGVGTGKTVAKIGSDLDKPDGLVVVQPGDEADFLAPLAVKKLWGIGPKTAERLGDEGVETIGDLARQSLDWFAKVFGKRASDVRNKALGQDTDRVHVRGVTKSISSETTFAGDVGNEEELRNLVEQKAVGIARQLERNGLKGRTVKLKLRLSDFTTFTRQTTLPCHTDSEEQIKDAASKLLELELEPQRTFRLLGVGVANFEHGSETAEATGTRERQLPLFIHY